MFKSLSSPRALRIIEILNESSMSLTELSEALGIKKPTVSKYLARMEDEGLISSRIVVTGVGRERTFQLEPFTLVLSIDPEDKLLLSYRSNEGMDLELPLMGQIKQEEFRTASRAYVKRMISKTKADNMSIIVFGSVAMGNAGRKSDIDLLLLSDSWTKASKDRMLTIISDATVEAEIQAKPLFWTYKEFGTKDDYFAKHIRQDGILVFNRRGGGPIWQHLKRYRSIWL
jgi:predicted nucleotidyltransferase